MTACSSGRVTSHIADGGSIVYSDNVSSNCYNNVCNASNSVGNAGRHVLAVDRPVGHIDSNVSHADTYHLHHKKVAHAPHDVTHGSSNVKSASHKVTHVNDDMTCPSDPVTHVSPGVKHIFSNIHGTGRAQNSHIYDGIQYNVKVAHNRYTVLPCDDAISTHEIDAMLHDTPTHQSPCKTVRRNQGTQCTAGGHQVAVSCNRQARPDHSHEGASPNGGEDARYQGKGGGNVITAVMSWSTPRGKIESQALGDLSSIPIAIRGRKCRAMLDTGASINCIRKAWVEELDLSKLMTSAHDREVTDAQGKDMEVYGQLPVPIVIGDTPLWVNCIVTETLPLPVILGVPFMRQTNAKFDFGSNSLLLRDCVASITDISIPTVPVTPITDYTITFHCKEEVVLQPNSETMIQCDIKIEQPYAKTDCQNNAIDCSILEVLRSDLLYNNKSLIVKPTTVYRQDDGTYLISIINPASKKAQIQAGEHLTDGKIKLCKQYTPSLEVPEALKLLPNNVLDRPLQMEDSKDTHHTDCVAGIQVLWPEQPYCPPVQIDSCSQKNRTVGCQAEVDIGNQTRIQTFQPLDWSQLLKLEPQAESYRGQLQAILDKHRPAFAADLNEIAIMEGVFYRIDLMADAEPVNIRTYRMSPAHEEELDRQLKKTSGCRGNPGEYRFAMGGASFYCV